MALNNASELYACDKLNLATGRCHECRGMSSIVNEYNCSIATEKNGDNEKGVTIFHSCVS